MGVCFSPTAEAEERAAAAAGNKRIVASNTKVLVDLVVMQEVDLPVMVVTDIF